MTFWAGGVDPASCSTTEVRRQVLERLETISRGRGSVFKTVRDILPEVPPEYVVAVFDGGSRVQRGG